MSELARLGRFHLSSFYQLWVQIIHPSASGSSVTAHEKGWDQIEYPFEMYKINKMVSFVLKSVRAERTDLCKIYYFEIE
jgi:hypothetical protein